MENRKGRIVITFESFLDNFEDLVTMVTVDSAHIFYEERIIILNCRSSYFRDLGDVIQLVPEYDVNISVSEDEVKRMWFEEKETYTPVMGSSREVSNESLWILFFTLNEMNSTTSTDIKRLNLKEDDILVVEVSQLKLHARDLIADQVKEVLESMQKTNTVIVVQKGEMEFKVIGSEGDSE